MRFENYDRDRDRDRDRDCDPDCDIPWRIHPVHSILNHQISTYQVENPVFCPSKNPMKLNTQVSIII